MSKDDSRAYLIRCIVAGLDLRSTVVANVKESRSLQSSTSALAAIISRTATPNLTKQAPDAAVYIQMVLCNKSRHPSTTV